MRFGLPRSPSPSPVRRTRRATTFGLHSDSEEEYNAYDYESDSSSSSSSSSSISSPLLDRGRHKTIIDDLGSPLKRSETRALDTKDDTRTRQLEDTVATIRLWARYRDPYEEWEKKTRKDAFKTARKELSTTQSLLHDARTKSNSVQDQTLAATHAKQMSEIESQLSSFRLAQEKEETVLRENWKAREKALWDRIESVIRLEEGKVAARLEAERQKREAEEKKKREEDLKKRLEEERKKAEEEKQKAEEEKKRKDEEDKKKKEEEDAKRKQEEERLKKEKLSAEANVRNRLGFRTASQDWSDAREGILAVKTNLIAGVKSVKELKSEWNKYRRQITPKVGQVTNDEASIQRVTTELVQLLKPNPPHINPVYSALCYSLSKAILLQAETEVTAEKRSAIPLARVAFNLMTTLEVFPDMFWAKLVQRMGGWAIPCIIPDADVDGRAWSTGEKRPGRGGEKEKWKVMGYRMNQSSGNGEFEAQAEYSTRVSGIMRVYWEILKVQLMFPHQAPPDGPFVISRYWMWFSRLLEERPLLETAVGAELIYTALEVMGAEAADIWGLQWIKILQLIYDGTTVGIYGQENKFIGGDSPEGKAAKARVRMEVERIVTGQKKS